MKKSKAVPASGSTRRMRPALTPEARESQLISMATDLIEQRLKDGTASSQETTSIIKGTLTKARLEIEILQKQKELIEAKTESLKAGARLEELYTNAMNAMRRYNGQSGEDDEY